jgi:multimeric flavodoxin WrbA
MDNKELKNFADFLAESWDNTESFITEFEDEITSNEDETENTSTEQIEDNIETEVENKLKAFGDDIEVEAEVEHDGDEFEAEIEAEVEMPLPSVDPHVSTLGTQLSTQPEKSEMKVVVLNGVVATSTSAVNPATSLSVAIQEKIGALDTKEIKLFQLNIQPLSDGAEEPLDGMDLVYQAIQGADAIIVVSNIKKGQISSVLQAAMERIGNYYKQKELRNVVFGSVIAGEEDAHQNVKSSLLNFANNMGMIVGGDCNVFCCAEEGESCEHQYEADTTCAATCIKELCAATKTIRASVPAATTEVPASTSVLPSLSDAIKSFDEFEKGMDVAPVDNGLEPEAEAPAEENVPALPEMEEREIEEMEMGGQLATFSEEEETAYDYMNNIVYNPEETPMTKPRFDIAEELPEVEQERKEAEEGEIEETEEESTNESILDFNNFLNKQI